MKKEITFNTKNYVGNAFQIAGWSLGLLVIGLFFPFWYMFPFWFFLTVLLITTKYQISIDTERRVVDDYLSVLGGKNQLEKFHYLKLEQIYITKSRYSQRINMESISSTVRGNIYNAYLKTDVANIYLGENTSLKQLERKVAPLAKKLELEVEHFIE